MRGQNEEKGAVRRTTWQYGSPNQTQSYISPHSLQNPSHYYHEACQTLTKRSLSSSHPLGTCPDCINRRVSMSACSSRVSLTVLMTVVVVVVVNKERGAIKRRVVRVTGSSEFTEVGAFPLSSQESLPLASLLSSSPSNSPAHHDRRS